MKRLALISDVHGNYKALEAFLEYIEEHPVDGIICLGDYVTDSPYPERTMELLHKMRETRDCCMLRGNREDYLLDNAHQPVVRDTVFLEVGDDLAGLRRGQVGKQRRIGPVVQHKNQGDDGDQDHGQGCA